LNSADISTGEKSADGPADLRADEVPFPRFIVKTGDGVFANLAKLESSADFQSGVERIFSAGYYFTELDYARFLELLHDFYEPEKISLAQQSLEDGGKEPMIRFAADVAAFLPQRRALYKMARISDGKAEYIFEPVMLETRVEAPAISEEEGVVTSAGIEQKPVSEHTLLSFDEFVSDMWAKGVRYGIDAAAVREIIGSGETERLIFARPLEPIAGKNAGIEEQMAGLHRDDAPKDLPNGRIDLRQFKNHFPQVGKGVRLLKKTPRALGVPGQDVGGQPIEPPLPKDFDLADLSGPGTRVERSGEGEFIIANLEGFLNLDTATNLIAVVEKIVNRSGVSVRTTGNISLTCDEFEEYGEIQEKRVVEGKSITVHADVFGLVISLGGRIHLKQNLSGGSATNHDGDIEIDDLATGAIVHAKKGTVVIKRAQNCLIVGKKVVVESAIKCIILGEEVEVAESLGCAIAGKSVRVGRAGPHKETPTLVSVLVPDLSGFDRQIGGVRRKVDEIKSAIAKLHHKSAAITGQGEVRNYLALHARLKNDEITLTPEQKENWNRLVILVAPYLTALAKLDGKIQELENEKEPLDGKIEAFEQGKQDASTGVACSIETSLSDDTLVRTMKIQPNAAPLADLPPKQLRALLNTYSLPGERLFSGRGGPFNWQYQAPGEEEEA